MLKKLVKGIILSGTLLGILAGGASADMDLNLYGASAQHKFWSSMAKPFLEQYCTSATDYSFNKKHAMTVGQNCTINGNNHANVYFRYSSRASYDGVNAVRGTDGFTRTMCAAPDCAALDTQTVNLGASDVAGTSFVQATQGWEDGNQSYPNFSYIANDAELNFPNEPADIADLEEFKPIVVPFGFYVSNCVKEYRCTAPGAGLDKAYDRWGTSCVPNTPGADGISDDCVGYHKCLGWQDLPDYCTDAQFTDETACLAPGVCSDPAYTTITACETAGETWTSDNQWVDAEQLGTCNGGLNAGQECDEADDCPDVAVASTMCTAMPINNITQNMARQIFDDLNPVVSWTDFGPEYFVDTTGACSTADGYIRLCMRHAGSGTHATFDLLVMDGKSMNTTSFQAFDYWHFTSSSDLTKCVTDLPGAIGYADADKLLTFEEIGSVPGAHLVKYNGVWPSQRNIVNGLYEFWAAQHIYYEADNLTADQEWLRAQVDTYSSVQANIDSIGKGDYWAAQGAMLVERLTDDAPITRK